jgi:hypothetical protein
MRIVWIIVVFRRMRIRSLNLYEAFRADWLITAPCLVEIRRVVKEANGTLGSILVKKRLHRMAMYIWILGKLQFLRSHVLL